MTETPIRPLTMSLEEAAPLIPCKVSHYRSRLAAGIWPGTKPVREWRVTPAQVQQAIDLSSTQARLPDPPRPSGLTKRSRTFKQKPRGGAAR